MCYFVFDFCQPFKHEVIFICNLSPYSHQFSFFFYPFNFLFIKLFFSDNLHIETWVISGLSPTVRAQYLRRNSKKRSSLINWMIRVSRLISHQLALNVFVCVYVFVFVFIYNGRWILFIYSFQCLLLLLFTCMCARLLLGLCLSQYSGKSATANISSGGKNFIHSFAQIHEISEICREVRSRSIVILLLWTSLILIQIEIVFFDSLKFLCCVWKSLSFAQKDVY